LFILIQYRTGVLFLENSKFKKYLKLKKENSKFKKYLKLKKGEKEEREEK